MYVGGLSWEGFLYMFEEVLSDLIGRNNNAAEINIECYTDSRICLEVKSIDFRKLERNLNNLALETWHDAFGLGLIVALSQNLQITVEQPLSILMLQAGKGEFNVTASSSHKVERSAKFDINVDVNIFKISAVRYAHLNLFLAKFAYLNPGIKIISVDKTNDEYQRNVFQYLNGVSDQLDDLLATIKHPYTHFRLDFKTTIGDFEYQIALCNQQHLQQGQYIRTYANNQEAYLGGSLVDGILLGLLRAAREIASKEGIQIKINKGKIKQNIIVIAAVRGENFFFSGATKWTLDMPLIKTAISHFILKAYLNI